MKPALHRSITFWSGILVMMSIAWAWWDSFRHKPSLYCGGVWMVSSGGGIATGFNPPLNHDFEVDYHDSIRVVVGWSAFQMPFYGRGQASTENIMPDERKTASAPSWYRAALRHRLSGCWILFIPHWLLLLGVLLPWTGLLVWRARRHKQPPADA